MGRCIKQPILEYFYINVILTLQQPDHTLFKSNWELKCAKFLSKKKYGTALDKLYWVKDVAGDGLVLYCQVISRHKTEQNLITFPGISSC